MNNLIIYSIEIAISLALFYLAYWLFLQKETFFKLNRFYLMSSVVLSLLIPLLNISVMPNSGNNSFINKYLILPIEQYEQHIIENVDYKKFPLKNKNTISKYNGNKGYEKAESTNQVSSTNEVTALLNASKQSDTNKSINGLTIVLVIYFIGVALFLIRFIGNFIWIFSYTFKQKSQQILGMKVIRLKKNSSPFSFLNFIFLSYKEYPEDELTKIISHEKVHIQQKHSIDLILLELLLVFQWFNPFVWFYKRAVKINHEYLADQGTLNSGVDMPGYQYSLLNQVLQENNFEIASNYNLSIKKRIAMMMKKRSTKLSALKVSIALPILIFLFSAFALKSISPKESTNNGENKLSVYKELSVYKDTSIKKVNVPIEYLKLLEGEYVSTNEPNHERRIIFTEVLGTLFGFDDGYTYKIIPVGDGKFINPDDHASLVFTSRDKNAISLLLFGRINLNKLKIVKGSNNVQKKSLAFTSAKVMLEDGIPKGLSYFKLAKDSSNYYITQNEMNILGYELLNFGKTKEASAIFKLNTESYPDWFNAFDSYADALMVLGEKKLAIENYKKSLQLNPGNANGLKKLKEMGINTDTHVKAAKVSIEYLKQLEGDYLSTNQPNWVRWIKFVEEGGVLVGNDNGYRYKLIPMGGDGKFINPDDGASLIFDTENKNGITLSLFGTINLKKVKTSKESTLSLKEYSGIYIPSKKDTILRPMEILNSKNKLFRFIENPSDFTPNRNIELEFVTENIFFYPDKSNRSIEFIVNDKKEVTGCFVRRPDGTFQLSKQK